MKRILFVDDEQMVLDGLRNLLRKQRHRWEMVFVIGGQAALAALKESRFDVIVTDMRMPGMDGPELLQRVKDQYSSVARLVLSGHADPQAMMRVVSVAHQFLSKPCDEATLRTSIEQTCELQALLNDPTIQSVVGKIDKLPSVPQLYRNLTEAMANPKLSLGDVAKIIQGDPAMTVKILQLVNSAYFGARQKITSINQAVSYLGIELIRGLVLSSHVFGSFTVLPVIPGFSVEAVQAHGLLCARFAKRWLPTSGPASADAFVAGLIHDVGELVWASCNPKGFAECFRVAKETGRPRYLIEKELLGASHADLGAYLLGMWGLPHSIVQTVAYHHAPTGVDATQFGCAGAVYLIDSVLEGKECDPRYIEAAGITHHVPKWRAEILKETQPMGAEAQA